MKIPRFYYIEYGSQETILTELRYSLATLQAEGVNANNISIVTDNPERYKKTLFDIIDISKKISTYRGAINYGHRIKPSVIFNALTDRDEPLVLLDTDTYIKQGFLKEVDDALSHGVGMNFFIRRDPYRGFGPFSTTLPSGQSYSYDPRWSIMYNSGVIAVKPEHKAVIKDSIDLIDNLWAAGLTALDVDQFAATETFRIHNVKISPIHRNIHHYHSRWTRKYIIQKLNKKENLDFENINIRRPDLMVNKTLVRLFKAKTIVRSWLDKLLSNLRP